jgi:DNA repair exonuclease SbcCD nuclease subunit
MKNKTLVIGDLHLENKIPGLLDAQCKCIKKIKKEHNCPSIVLLGDVFNNRRPKPSVILAAYGLVHNLLSPSTSHGGTSTVHVLRGNHDSENKNDDGISAISLLGEDDFGVVKHIQTLENSNYTNTFIPHYEDENKIREDLKNVKQGSIVFGHFGYFGSLNSAGDNDFSLVLSDFTNRTYLGHIHTYKREGNVTLVGTPYTTSFTEAGKDSYVVLVGDDGEEDEKILIDHGPRHLIIEIDNILDNLEFINDPNYFTLLRVVIPTANDEREDIGSILNKVKVGYVEVKYKPVIYDIHQLSTLDPDNPVIEVSDSLVEEYINHSETLLPKEDLMSGLQTINENKQNRNK